MFGLSFGAPALLWGMAFASAPILIHLLNRQRYRERDWAAMRWLLEAIRKQSRRLRVEQWILLAIRTLLLLLVAIAMARPAMLSPRALFAGNADTTHTIVVFDNTLSMSYSLSDKSRWDRAKTLAESALEDSRKGDVASVVVMGPSANVLVGDPSPYLSAVSAEIAAIRPQHGGGRIEPAVDKVADILKISNAGRKQILFLTDLQRCAWTGGSADPTSLAAKLRGLAAQANCRIVDVAGGDSPNLAVTAISQVDPLIVSGRSTIIRATIANFGGEPREGLRAECLIDGQVETVETLSLPAGEQRQVHFSIAISEPGDHAIEVRLPDDSLRVDNHRYLALTVRESLSVLLVEGEPSGRKFQSESDYLRVALSPGGSAEGGASLIRTETKLESDLLEANLEEYDLVALSNVGRLTPAEKTVLEAFVKRGGSALFFLGSQTDIEAYNRQLWSDGKGMLPAQLLGAIAAPPPKDPPPTSGPARGFFAFDPLGYSHRIVKPFQGRELAGLLSTKVFRYVRCKPRESTEAPSVVALAYQSGDAAIVIGEHGKGRVGLVTTSADLDWNTWALSPSFVPIVQELARELVAGRVRRPEILVGEPIVSPMPENAQGSPVSMKPPGGEGSNVPVRLEPIGGVVSLQYPATDVSGVYRARIGSPIDKDIDFAVNTWPEESELSRISEAELKQAFPGWEFSISDRVYDEPNDPNAPLATSGELRWPLLYAALVLLFVETLLAWRFGHHQ